MISAFANKKIGQLSFTCQNHICTWCTGEIRLRRREASSLSIPGYCNANMVILVPIMNIHLLIFNLHRRQPQKHAVPATATIALIHALTYVNLKLGYIGVH
jgi:hypothetical protein